MFLIMGGGTALLILAFSRFDPTSLQNSPGRGAAPARSKPPAKDPPPRSRCGAGGPASCGSVREQNGRLGGSRLPEGLIHPPRLRAGPEAQSLARPRGGGAPRPEGFGLRAAFHYFLEGLLPGSWWHLESGQTDAFVLRPSTHPGFPGPGISLCLTAVPGRLASAGRGFGGQRGGLCPGGRRQCWALLLGAPDPRASSAPRGPHSAAWSLRSVPEGPRAGGWGAAPTPGEALVPFSLQKGIVQREKSKGHQKERFSPKCGGCRGTPLGRAVVSTGGLRAQRQACAPPHPTPATLASLQALSSEPWGPQRGAAGPTGKRGPAPRHGPVQEGRRPGAPHCRPLSPAACEELRAGPPSLL